MMQLTVIEGPQAGTIFKLSEESFSIGRSRSNDVILQDDKVSSRHASIIQSAGRIIIRDLQSTNGTFLNSMPIDAAIIRNGDTVHVGNSILVFEKPNLPASADTATVRLVNHAAGTEPKIHETIASSEHSIFDVKDAKMDIDSLVSAHRNLQALYKVNSVLNSTFDMSKLFERIMDQIFLVTRADRGALMLVDQKTGDLVPKAIRTRDGETSERLNLSKTIVNQVMEKGTGILTSDATSDERFSSGDSVAAFQIRSAMCVPMRCKDHNIGIIYVDSKMSSGQFRRSDLELLTALGNEAGVAIENGQLYEANVRAERLAALGEALAGLSHYIKNILMCMQGGGQLVQKVLDDQSYPAIEKGWGIVRRNERKLSELVMDMLSYCKERMPVYEDCNLGEIIIDLIEMSRPLQDDKSITVRHNCDKEQVIIKADTESLVRCMLNIFSNAIDAVEAEKGVIEITIGQHPERGHAFFIFADNGCGIPTDVQPRIFDAFCSTKGSKGTGLGLAVSSKIIKEHGGRIDVKSKVGRGTTFTIRLPLNPYKG